MFSYCSICGPLCVQDRTTASEPLLQRAKYQIESKSTIHMLNCLAAFVYCLPIANELMKELSQESGQSCCIHVGFRVLYSDTC